MRGLQHKNVKNLFNCNQDSDPDHRSMDREASFLDRIGKHTLRELDRDMCS